MKRNYILDKYRGFTIISMVLFHLFYDISLYKNLTWYNNFYNKYGRNSFLAKIGQNSLKIYVLHQVIIYGFVYFVFEII